mgnify:CR=1 FL=1
MKCTVGACPRSWIRAIAWISLLLGCRYLFWSTLIAIVGLSNGRHVDNLRFIWLSLFSDAKQFSSWGSLASSRIAFRCMKLAIRDPMSSPQNWRLQDISSSDFTCDTIEIRFPSWEKKDITPVTRLQLIDDTNTQLLGHLLCRASQSCVISLSLCDYRWQGIIVHHVDKFYQSRRLAPFLSSRCKSNYGYFIAGKCIGNSKMKKMHIDYL